MSYLNHSYNDSPTIWGQVAEAQTAPAMLAFAFDENGKFILPAKEGDPVVGICLADADGVEKDGGISVQYKNGCLWLAGEAVKRGDYLKADTTGKAKKATDGNILAIALEDAEADKPCPVLIVHMYIAPSEAA